MMKPQDPLRLHCFAVKCSNCGKTTWKGCGKHVESVMKDVPEEDRCTCPRE
ncbi:hypothetical protein BT69DRAFT_1255043 [Atractiella rhizophila]|nr:hypothetical protein BT69DRAFT_1255043 [Atractiella rhizophila]